jgi:membrane-associated phospholipid phosphatase
MQVGNITSMWTYGERLRWAIIAILVSLDVILLAATDMSVASDQLIVLAAALPLFAIGYVYRVMRPDPRLANAPIAIGQLLLFSSALLLLNYLVLSFERPLIDATVAQWDAALGFHWPDLFHQVFSTPWLKTLLIGAYNSSQVQVAIFILILGLSSRYAHLDRFILAFMIGGMITVAIWAPFPSFGSVHYHMTVATPGLPDLAKMFGYIAPQEGLLNGTLKHLTLQDITGIVGFPSFHTVMALVAIYAARPVPYLFWPVVIWNLLVVLAVPPVGGHFVVDVFGGAFIAWVSVLLAELLIPASDEIEPARPALQPA